MSDGHYSSADPRARLGAQLGTSARRRRHARLFPLTGVTEDARILDIGCGSLGLRAFEPDRDITGLDLAAKPDYPGPFVQADVLKGLPFEDDAFDLAYSNSVLEHLLPEHRPQFAREVRRVARGWYVQTPAWSFPLEPHALLPALHWLPVPWRRRYWQLAAGGAFEEIHLLRRAEMTQLFGLPHAERIGPIVKSWISIRPVAPQCGTASGGQAPADASSGVARLRPRTLRWRQRPEPARIRP